MKKIIALILALCLLCGAVAFATEINQDSTSQSAETILTTTIEESYTLTIPATLNIAYGATETDMPLTVSNYRLKSTNQLKLRQSWDGALENESGNTISYSLKYGNADVSSNTNPVTFDANGTKNLVVTIAQSAWNSAAPGTYTDTVTFTVSIAAK